MDLAGISLAACSKNGRRARRVPAMASLWPGRLRGQGHQDRLDIAAGLEAKAGAAVVKEIELDIAAAADQLVLPLRRGPRPVHALAHDRREHREKRVADRPDKREIALPIAAVEIIEKDAAGAARLAAMLQIEILVVPLSEAGIGIRLVAVAGCGERRVKLFGCGRIGIDRGQVGAAAEPCL